MIHFFDTAPGSVYDVRITDALGRLYSDVELNGTNEFPFAAPTGIYNVTLRDRDGRSFTSRLLAQH